MGVFHGDDQRLNLIGSLCPQGRGCLNPVIHGGHNMPNFVGLLVAHVLIHSQVPQRLAVYLLKCFFLLVAGSMLPWPLKRYYFIFIDRGNIQQ